MNRYRPYDQGKYTQMYRVLTGLTKNYSVQITTIGRLWRAGTPATRAMLVAEFGQAKVWAAIEVAEHGHRKGQGSGRNDVLEIPRKFIR